MLTISRSYGCPSDTATSSVLTVPLPAVRDIKPVLVDHYVNFKCYTNSCMCPQVDLAMYSHLELATIVVFNVYSV